MAQGPTSTAFTYQGQLLRSGEPANGLFDMEFNLYDASGNSLTSCGIELDVPVSNGLFMVQVDCGQEVFTGEERWLRIGVRPAGPGDFEVLPAQQLTPAPYALFATRAELVNDAAHAAEADNAAKLGGQSPTYYAPATHVHDIVQPTLRTFGGHSACSPTRWPPVSASTPIWS